MKYLLILFGTMTVMLLYFNCWWQFDQNGILLTMFTISWATTVYAGLRVFSKVKMDFWLLIPITCFSLVLLYSRDMLLMNLTQNGMATGVTDDMTYLFLGRRCANFIADGDYQKILTIQINQPGYVYVLGVLFTLLPDVITSEIQVLSAVSLNMILLSISTLLIMKYMLERHVKSSHALFLGLALTCYPALLGVAVVLRKDVFIAFLLTLLFVQYQEYRKHQIKTQLFIVLFIIFVLSLFRLPAGVLILAMIMFDIKLLPNIGARLASSRKSKPSIFLIFLLFVAIYGAYRLNYISESGGGGLFSKLENIAAVPTDKAMIDMRLSSLILKIPILGPPLWILTGSGLAAVFPRNWIRIFNSTSYSYMIVILLFGKVIDILLLFAIPLGVFVKGSLADENHRLLFIIIGMSILIGISFSHGSELRHKTMLLPFMFLLTSFTIFRGAKV